MSIKSQWLDATAGRDGWRHTLSLLPDRLRDVYFDPAYAALYAAQDEHAECFAFEDGDRLYLYPFLRRRVPAIAEAYDLTTPYGYGGPLSNSEDASFLGTARQAFEEKARGRGVVAEVIKFHPLLQNHHFLETTAFSGRLIPVSRTVYAPMGIADEDRWRIYNNSNRNKISKARRAAAAFVTGDTDGLWTAFRRLYAETMAANQAAGFYYFDDEYFEKIRKSLRGHYQLAAVLIDGHCAAVMLVLRSERFAHSHLLGTGGEFMSLGVNNLLHHEVIRWCEGQGLEAFHIGGGRTPSPQDSLLTFKQNFSNRLADFYVGECVLDNDRYQLLVKQWSEKHPAVSSHKLLRYRE